MHCPLCGTSDGVSHAPMKTLHTRMVCKWCAAETDITIEVRKAPDLIEITTDSIQRWGKYSATKSKSGGSTK